MAFMAERSQSNNLNSDKINSFTITALMPELPTPRKHWTQKNSDRMKDANAASAGGSIKKGLCAYIVRSAYITVELIIKSARNDRKCNLHACSMIRNVHFNMTKIRRKQHLSIQKKAQFRFVLLFLQNSLTRWMCGRTHIIKFRWETVCSSWHLAFEPHSKLRKRLPRMWKMRKINKTFLFANSHSLTRENRAALSHGHLIKNDYYRNYRSDYYFIDTKRVRAKIAHRLLFSIW